MWIVDPSRIEIPGKSAFCAKFVPYFSSTPDKIISAFQSIDMKLHLEALQKGMLLGDVDKIKKDLRDLGIASETVEKLYAEKTPKRPATSKKKAKGHKAKR